MNWGLLLGIFIAVVWTLWSLLDKETIVEITRYLQNRFRRGVGKGD